MEVPPTFDQVSFDAWPSAGDDPICYTVQVSDDAASWRAVACGAGTGQDYSGPRNLVLRHFWC